MLISSSVQPPAVEWCNVAATPLLSVCCPPAGVTSTTLPLRSYLTVNMVAVLLRRRSHRVPLSQSYGRQSFGGEVGVRASWRPHPALRSRTFAAQGLWSTYGGHCPFGGRSMFLPRLMLVGVAGASHVWFYGRPLFRRCLWWVVTALLSIGRAEAAGWSSRTRCTWRIIGGSLVSTGVAFGSPFQLYIVEWTYSRRFRTSPQSGRVLPGLFSQGMFGRPRT